MTEPAGVGLEDLSAEAAMARFDRVLEAAEAELARPRAHPAAKRAGRPHSDRTKKKLSARTFERRRVQTMLDSPTAVACARLAAGLTQGAAAEKALINSRTWCRAEANFSAVSLLTQRRVARALGVKPADLL